MKYLMKTWYFVILSLLFFSSTAVKAASSRIGKSIRVVAVPKGHLFRRNGCPQTATTAIIVRVIQDNRH